MGLPQSTVRRYLNLLETSHLLVRLPAYAVNRTKRLIKSPKVYWGDTGVALHLSQETQPRGPHLKNLDPARPPGLARRPPRSGRDLLLADHNWRRGRLRDRGRRPTAPNPSQSHHPPAPPGHRPPCEPSGPSTASAVAPGCCCTTATSSDWIAPDVLAAPWWRASSRRGFSSPALTRPPRAHTPRHTREGTVSTPTIVPSQLSESLPSALPSNPSPLATHRSPLTADH